MWAGFTLASFDSSFDSRTMTRTLARLTALSVTKTKKPGYYHDGGGLYLRVKASGGKSWIYRFMLNGQARAMGLGPLSIVSLVEARELAAACRKQRHHGVDPISARTATAAKARSDAANAKTFSDCAAAYIEAHKAGWRNAKHHENWERSLTAYVEPQIGSVAVQAIDTALVLKVLEPLWITKTETAVRVRGRIEAVLNWATSRGYRSGENPARWRGHLDNLLPKRSKVAKVRHHPALPYDEVTEFLAAVAAGGGVASEALRFLIFTVARTSEVIGAKWKEFDIASKLWTVPADRIKAGKEHRVPLSQPALAILARLRKAQGDPKPNDYVFPGLTDGTPLSNMAMLKLLERMGRKDLTVHGFRSTFRDWASERTDVPNEVAEMALAHAVSDKVEAAYRRGDLFEKRRDLMNRWAAFCTRSQSKQ